MLDKYFRKEEPAVVVSKCSEGCKICGMESSLNAGWAGLLRSEFSIDKRPGHTYRPMRH